MGESKFVVIRAICTSFSFLLFTNVMKAQTLDDPLSIQEYQDCWISIFRNPKVDSHPSMQLMFKFPVALPKTTLAVPVRHLEITKPILHMASKKYLKCSAYFIFYPDAWEMNGIGGYTRTSYYTRCDWYHNWSTMITFRDRIDHLIIFQTNHHICQFKDYNFQPIVNNIILTANGTNFRNLLAQTLIKHSLFPLTCPGAYFRECLTSFWKRSTNNGRTLILEWVESYGSMSNLETGFWNHSNLNYSRINAQVLKLVHPFHPPDVTHSSFDHKIINLAFDVIDVWLPSIKVHIKEEITRAASYINKMVDNLDKFMTGLGLPEISFEGNAQFIVTGSSGMSFTTKQGVARTHSYSIYITPYDGRSWAGILIFTILIPLIFLVAAASLKMPSKFELFGRVLMLNVSALLNVSPDISTTVFNSKFRRVFYCTIGIWFLLLVVLVEAYGGVIVRDLVAPPPWIHKWSKLKELRGFAIFGPENYINIEEKLHSVMGAEYELRMRGFGDVWYCACAKKRIIDHCKPQHDKYCEWLYGNLSEFGLNLESLEAGVASATCAEDYGACFRRPNKVNMVTLVPHGDKMDYQRLANLFFVRSNMEQFDVKSNKYFSDVYKAIKNRRYVAFMDDKERVHTFKLFANSKEEEQDTGRHYLTGSEIIFKNVIGHQILFSRGQLKSEHKWSIYGRLRGLMESGIYGLWEKWERIHFPRLSDEIEKSQGKTRGLPKALTLRTNSVSIFMICTTLVGISLLCLLAEYFSLMNRTECLRLWKLVYTRFNFYPWLFWLKAKT